ncbi:MAG: hypothetical protein A2174_00605 [Candidatus Portnoybacteria bacterium RBG_13_41_18]|uniref:Uncharacterized protein n=1 Tax=Candidatus Portnoybacteria bacterium RBG_13_41_18 TaxID=1801991 RepID=A0A1G2F6T2_9BACT|nr:MAG: hypothetical protein A2174_00605 [Candidatus Portnoybacteria bacterium RBG_13_41_18]
MKLFIKVKPNSKEERIEKISETNFVIRLKEPPQKNKANQALIRILAEYFKTSRQNVKILIGGKSRQKIISIE